MNFHLFKIFIIFFSISIYANVEYFSIDKIEINSKLDIDKNYWMKKVKIKKGELITSEKIKKIKENLKKNSKIKDVKMKLIKGSTNLLKIELEFNSLYKIDILEFNSKDNIDKKFWKKFLSIKEGSYFSNNDIDILKNRLLDTKMFSKISFQKKIKDGKNYLTFSLTKRLIIKKITINNNFPILEQEVKRKISYRVGRVFLKDKIDSIKKNIIKLYRENGYFNAKVDIETKTSQKYVNIIVNIKNIGVQLIIGKINFINREKVDEKILKKIKDKLKMSSVEKIIDYFNENDFKRRIKTTVLELQKEGYISTKIKLYRLPEEKLIVNYSDDSQINKKIITTYRKRLVSKKYLQCLKNKKEDENEDKKEIKCKYEKKDKFLEIGKRGFVFNYRQKRVDIWLSVKVGPLVKLKFKGMKLISTKDAKNILTIFNSASIYPSQLEKSVKKIKQYYQARGYYFVKVNYKIKKSPKEVIITFIVKENKKLYIRDIDIKGVKTKEFNKDELISMMNLGTYNYMGSSGYLQDLLFLNDLTMILDFYRTHGYFSVKIKNLKFNYFNNKRFLDIIIEIEEGDQTIYSKPKIFGIKDNKKEKYRGLQRYLKENKSNGFNLNWFISNGVLIEQYFHSNGYPLASVEAYIKGNFKERIKVYPVNKKENRKKIYDYLKENRNLSLLYTVNENIKKRFGSIFITGNLHTKLDTIKDEITFKKGAILKLEELKNVKNNLRSLNIFKTIIITTPHLNENPKDDAENTPVDIRISFEELKHKYLDFAAGISSNEPWTVSAKFTNLNIWGWAKKITILGKFGKIYNLGELNLNSPRLFSLKLGTNLQFFARSEKLPAFDLLSTGVAFSFYKTFWEKLSFALSFEIKSATTTLTPSNDMFWNNSFQNEERSVSFSIIPTLYWENRDNIFDPRHGFMFKLVGDWEQAAPWVVKILPEALKPNISNFEFYKIQFQVTGYLTPVKYLTLASSLRIGWSVPGDKDTQKIPKKDRFFLGGDSSIRGYKLNMFGIKENENPLGDNSMILFNFEARIHLFRWIKNFSLAFFTDIGGLSKNLDDFFYKKYYSDRDVLNLAIGVGVRYMTVIGPLRVDFAYLPFDSQINSPNTTEWVHFSFNYPF